MGRLTEDQLRLAAGTDRGPLRPKLLHQLSVLADRRAPLPGRRQRRSPERQRGRAGLARRYRGKELVYTWGVGLPQTAGVLAVHLVELVTRIPHSRPPKEPRRTWSPLMSDPTLNRPDPTQQVAGRLHRSSSLKRSRILAQCRGHAVHFSAKASKYPRWAACTTLAVSLAGATDSVRDSSRADDLVGRAQATQSHGWPSTWGQVAR